MGANQVFSQPQPDNSETAHRDREIGRALTDIYELLPETPGYREVPQDIDVDDPRDRLLLERDLRGVLSVHNDALDQNHGQANVRVRKLLFFNSRTIEISGSKLPVSRGYIDRPWLIEFNPFDGSLLNRQMFMPSAVWPLSQLNAEYIASHLKRTITGER